MEKYLGTNYTGTILFIAFFILFGLEFIIPLVQRRSRHLISNVLFLVVLTSINFVFTSITFLLADWTGRNGIGFFHWLEIPTVWMVIISIIFLDFWAGYLIHFLLHQFEWLWGIHSIHHTDDLVDVTTTFRQHPVESILRVFFQFAGLIILGIPVWVLLIYLTISTLHAQFEHANIRIPRKVDAILQYFVVTPNMHKVHHSKYQHETDSNYSNIFSVWDRLFKTYKRKEDYQSIDYGLDYLENKHYSFWELIKLPFRKYRAK